MGLFGSAGLKNGGAGIANIIAQLQGQDITARSFTATQAAGSDAFKATVTGARWHIGPGTTDYFSSNGNDTVTAAATLYAATLGVPASGFFILDNGGFLATLRYNGSTGSVELLTPAGFTPSTDGVGTIGTTSKRWAGLALSQSDSSGTPGNAVINLPSGRSAIAIGAATVTVTNSLALAGSRIFISPLARDVTGLLPTVTTHGAGSFTVTTTANCTAALSFDWLVVS